MLDRFLKSTCKKKKASKFIRDYKVYTVLKIICVRMCICVYIIKDTHFKY